MNELNEAYIDYNIIKSDQAFADAELLFENNSYHATINRLYYSSYYLISALLYINNYSSHTHGGLKTQFNLHFVKTNKISAKMSKFFSELMDWRFKGDYGEMIQIENQLVFKMFAEVLLFNIKIKELIDLSKK